MSSPTQVSYGTEKKTQKEKQALEISTKHANECIVYNHICSNVLHSVCDAEYVNTHPFNGPLSGTTQVGLYQKGKTNLDFTEARDSEWQWHQLGYMQVCTSFQADNMPALQHSVFCRPDALPAAQPTVSKH